MRRLCSDIGKSLSAAVDFPSHTTEISNTQHKQQQTNESLSNHTMIWTVTKIINYA